VDGRASRLAAARLYLVCDERPDAFLRSALRGGVDIVQLRMKHAPEASMVQVARRFAAVCSELGALFIVNDRPSVALAAGADGVHIGQDDVPLAQARRVVGEERLVGLSTHTPDQVNAAMTAGVDYIGVGPVHATPTKPGRPAVGLERVRYAAQHATLPFFAIGGVSAETLEAVRDAGASRIAVVRALTRAEDVEAAARQLRSALAGKEAIVGRA
jgi:thiamine-phosphate pyrophosphorylase